MAKKERSYNPAHEQHKKDKKRALEKLKHTRQNAHMQNLSRRNPSNLESQIQNLKSMDAQNRLSDADRAVLNTLEKELKLVRKAKAQFAGQTRSGPEIVSDRTKGREAELLKEKEKQEKRAFKEVLKNKRDPKRSVYYDEVWNPYGVPPPGLPWKERDEDDSEGWSTDSDVRRIPMPRDTPPATQEPKPAVRPAQPAQPVRRESTPPQEQPVEKLPEPVEPKQGPSATIEEAFLRAGATTIEAAPVLRNFEKEAAAFVPSAVKRRPAPKKQAIKEEIVEGKVEGTGRPTTVEDAEDEEAVQDSIKEETVKETPVSNGNAPPFLADTLKRPLEVEMKVKVPSAPAVPPKRRRMVNAAPDV